MTVLRYQPAAHTLSPEFRARPETNEGSLGAERLSLATLHQTERSRPDDWSHRLN
jgi:hypothetical protein